MEVKRGEVWLANLNPTMGSEQAGFGRYWFFRMIGSAAISTTILAIPFTSNLRRANLPSWLAVSEGNGGLTIDSVLLCHQMRVLDQRRLMRRLGVLGPQTFVDAETRLLFTIGIIGVEEAGAA